MNKRYLVSLWCALTSLSIQSSRELSDDHRNGPFLDRQLELQNRIDELTSLQPLSLANPSVSSPEDDWLSIERDIQLYLVQENRALQYGRLVEQGRERQIQREMRPEMLRAGDVAWRLELRMALEQSVSLPERALEQSNFSQQPSNTRVFPRGPILRPIPRRPINPIHYFPNRFQ